LVLTDSCRFRFLRVSLHLFRNCDEFACWGYLSCLHTLRVFGYYKCIFLRRVHRPESSVQDLQLMRLSFWSLVSQTICQAVISAHQHWDDVSCKFSQRVGRIPPTKTVRYHPAIPRVRCFEVSVRVRANRVRFKVSGSRISRVVMVRIRF